MEQVTGMPVLEIEIDKAEIARRGLSLFGRAGRDRHRHRRTRRRSRVRGRPPLPDRRPPVGCAGATTSRRSRTCRSRCRRPAPGASAATIPLRQLATFHLSEGPNQISRENGKRRVVVTANVRGRDMGSLVDEAQAKIAEQVKLPPGYWLTWGGQFENFVTARAAAADRGARLLRVDLPAAAERTRLRAGCAAGVQRGAAGAHRRRRRAVAARHDVFDLRRRSASSRCPASPCSTAW